METTKTTVTKADLLNIRPSRTQMFTLSTWSHCRSVQSYAQQLKYIEPYPRFATRINQVEGQWCISVTRLS